MTLAHKATTLTIGICSIKSSSGNTGESLYLHAAAPASESKERRLKATRDDEFDKEEDDPPSSESVRRAGGNGSRGLG